MTKTAGKGDIRLLDHPVAIDLLESAIPARLGYVAADGSPRVSPMWFAWSGGEIVFGSAPDAPKVSAIVADPRVAVTIDSESAPYNVLLIRGVARVELLEGPVPEYLEAAGRYFGEAANRFREQVLAKSKPMVRISVDPDWVDVIDFRTRFPSNYGDG